MKLRLACFVAGASGFIALSYEILWYRLFAFVSKGKPAAFGVLLGAYLLGIALGSFGARWLCRRTADGTAGVGGPTARALSLCLLAGNVVSFLVAPATGWFATLGHWHWALGVVALATILLGAVLPLTSHLAIVADDAAGARLSYLYLCNILGSCLGSLGTGFVAMDHGTTMQIAVVIACLGFALAGGVRLAVDPSSRSLAWKAAPSAVATLAVLAGSHAAFDQLYERLLRGKDFTADEHFLETVENRSGLIHVTADEQVYGGGAYDGALNVSLVHDKNLIFRAFAVSYLHPHPRRMLMIGLASGSWATVLAASPGLEHLTIIEINPGYLEIIARHPDVAGILADPKVDIQIDDGRRWLLAHPDERFDVIVMNTTWHWRANITNLLSREFFALVKSHMTQGGLFYLNSTGSLDVCKTVMSSFPSTFRVSNFYAASDRAILPDPSTWKPLLESYRIGGAPVLDLATAEGRATEARLVRFMQPRGLESDVDSDDGVRARCASGEVITDDNMRSEWRSERAPWR